MSKQDRLSPCLKAALLYVQEHRWKLFPARMEGGKKWSWMSGKKHGRENWDATNDPGQLYKNFSRLEKQGKCVGVGLPTGADNGIFIIEIDTMKGHGVDGPAALKRFEADHDKLPPTRMSSATVSATEWPMSCCGRCAQAAE